MSGGADWNTPSLSTAYSSFLSQISDRLVDSITLQKTAPSNLPDGAIKWDRTNKKFQEWNSGGGTFADMIIDIASGGLAAATASGGRTTLGLGDMAVQNAAGVAITGGSISAGCAIAAGAIQSGTIAQARLGTGSDGSGNHFLADDQTYKSAPAESHFTISAVKSADFTASLTEKPTVYPLTGSHTVTLPTVVGNAGKRIVLVNRSTGTWTIAANGGETILGASTLSFGFGQYGAVVLVADANNALWDVI